MAARVPQDVDLEDKLIYGLSPLRFGYLVVSVLATLTLWRVMAIPLLARVAAGLLLLGCGLSLAWGRWRSRPTDRWILDGAVFIWRNWRIGRRQMEPAGGEPQAGTGPAATTGATVIPLVAINSLSEMSGADAPDLPPAA